MSRNEISEETYIPDAVRNTKKPVSAPILAFGSGLTGLGVLRCLAESNLEVYSVCAPGELPTSSRWYRPAPACKQGPPTAEHLPEYLEQLPFENAVLIPCSDDWARAIADLQPPLTERFYASTPDADVIDTLTDKWRFAKFLHSLSLPKPKSLRLHSWEDAAELPESAFENMFLKPIHSQEFARAHRVKAFRLRDKRQALEILRQIDASHPASFPVLLQEYIPGPVTNYFLLDGFVDRNRQLCALMARRRESQYPRWFGNSSRSVTIPLNEVSEAIESLERMLLELPYRGVFDAEFKYDERDHQFKVLEINPRPWWFVEFAQRCGVSLCSMAYRDALDLPVKHTYGFDIGRRCVYMSYDMAAHLDADPGALGFLRWARSCRGVEDIIFRRDDPKPAAASAIASARAYIRNVARGTQQA